MIIKATTVKTLPRYDEEKYLSVIAPSEERFEEYSEASLYYLINGVMPNENTGIKLFKYPAVFRTKFGGNDYILFLQENIQKNGKTGFILTLYPVNFIQTKTVGEFIDLITNKAQFAPLFPSVYKFGSVETCNKKFNDKNYWKWLFSNQKAIYKIIKKWDSKDIVPIGIMRYPLILNKNRI